MKINYPYELSQVVNELQNKPYWGKPELSRCMKSTKELLSYFEGSPLRKYAKSYDIACVCLRDLVDWFNMQNLSWSMESAIIKYRSKWLQHIEKYGEFKRDIFK